MGDTITTSPVQYRYPAKAYNEAGEHVGPGEWLTLIHHTNVVRPGTFGEPTSTGDWWAGGYVEEYPDARVIHHDDGPDDYSKQAASGVEWCRSVSVIAKTEAGALALARAAQRIEQGLSPRDPEPAPAPTRTVTIHRVRLVATGEGPCGVCGTLVAPDETQPGCWQDVDGFVRGSVDEDHYHEPNAVEVEVWNDGAELALPFATEGALFGLAENDEDLEPSEVLDVVDAFKALLHDVVRGPAPTHEGGTVAGYRAEVVR